MKQLIFVAVEYLVTGQKVPVNNHMYAGHDVVDGQEELRQKIAALRFIMHMKGLIPVQSVFHSLDEKMVERLFVEDYEQPVVESRDVGVCSYCAGLHNRRIACRECPAHHREDVDEQMIYEEPEDVCPECHSPGGEHTDACWKWQGVEPEDEMSVEDVAKVLEYGMGGSAEEEKTPFNCPSCGGSSANLRTCPVCDPPQPDNEGKGGDGI